MRNQNVGSHITTSLGLDSATVGAGVGGSGSETTGNVFDRLAYFPRHLSGKLAIAWKATLASGNSATIIAGLQHSDDDNTYTNLENASGAVSIAALNSGAAQRGVLEIDVDLTGAKRYIRPRRTPTLSASGVDTMVTTGLLMQGGGNNLAPATFETQ